MGGIKLAEKKGKKKDYNELLRKVLKALNDVEVLEKKIEELSDFKKINLARIDQIKKDIRNNNQIKILKEKQRDLEHGISKIDQDINSNLEKQQSLNKQAAEISLQLSTAAKELGRIEVVIYPIEYYEGK